MDTRVGDHERLMEQAFALAEHGRGSVEPNPRVGAIALGGGRIVGRGYHAEYGGHHAEIGALDEALTAGARPDTLFVTLEPCSTIGKTPACVEAVLHAGIRKVYVGAIDPNPMHAGRGIAILREHGVEVIHLGADLRFADQNKTYLRAISLRRPWVLAKWAMTLDGRSALANGDSKWISSERAREFVHRLRGRCEGVAVGVSTILRDDPLLTCRGNQLLSKPPARIIFDSQLRTPPQARMLVEGESPVWIITLEDAPAERRRGLERAGAEILNVPPEPQQAGRPRACIAAAMELLFSRGIRRLLVEAGPELIGALRAARVVDQILCVVAPRLAGGPPPVPGPAGLPEFATMEQALVLDDVYVERIHTDILIGGFINIGLQKPDTAGAP
ncbi:MAG: bifunctional diaminohydroxyphosphoribosylaminopyrimidine deaminase/5-amino-6-(5-phosphoribosylamino)uracil reductase RibD [Planctomycetes bacterium]|nr:bifunctional diaminohydroxyphosphoribosylaminopyrimidine deaminase/5-amino-6-(5-phosphoribosylamino)uracil reductase RibD [Planctomycetota bacterium]